MRVCWGQPTTISASYFFRLLQEGSSARAHGYGFGFNRESDEGSNQLAPFYAHLLDHGALWKLRSGNVICNALPYTGNEAIMKHPERNRAKRIDSPDRCQAFTGIVYGGAAQNPAECYRGLGESIAQFMPPANEFFLFFGDLHGHSDLSDGKVDVDTFFKNSATWPGRISARWPTTITAAWESRRFGRPTSRPAGASGTERLKSATSTTKRAASR